MHMILQIYPLGKLDFSLFQYKTNQEVCLSDLSFSCHRQVLFPLDNIMILKLQVQILLKIYMH